jgi:hypothetical protein
MKGGWMKDVRRALRKLATVKRAIRRMRRQLARTLAERGKPPGGLVERIVNAKAEAARLSEELDQRRTAVA